MFKFLAALVCPDDAVIVFASESPEGFTIDIIGNANDETPSDALLGNPGVTLAPTDEIEVKPENLNPDEEARIMQVAFTVEGATSVTITLLDSNDNPLYTETVRKRYNVLLKLLQ